LSSKDLQIVAKGLGFLAPPAPGGTVAVIYSASSPASKADADEIAGLFGDGVASKAGGLKAKAVDVASLGGGAGYLAVIVVAGVHGDAAIAAAKAHKIPCITAVVALVQGGHCVMAVQSGPKVEITVNHDAAQSAGISFTSAFRTLIHEI
jgi:hypothetical protein